MQKQLWKKAVGRGWRTSEEHDRENLNCFEQAISIQQDANSESLKACDVIGNQRKKNPCYVATESLAKLSHEINRKQNFK